MRYDDFRDGLKDALREAGYVLWPARTEETLDLRSAARSWKTFLDADHLATAEPLAASLGSLSAGGQGGEAAAFHVCQEVSFTWSARDFARTDTTEDDLLIELFGGDEDLPATLPRHLRIDMALHATLPWGSRALMPSRSHWRSWACSVDSHMAAILPAETPMMDGRPVVVMAWRGMAEVTSRCADDGELCLGAVTLPTWQAVVPPRVRDGEDDDGDITAQLKSLAQSYRIALDEWVECVAELGTLIRQPSRQE